MAKTVSWILGVVLIIAGIWGLFSQPMPAIGFIAANVASSIVHIVVGIIVLAMAGKSSAGMTLKVIGIIYAIWGIIGMTSMAFMPADTTTNWFYLIVGVVVAIIGFMSKGSSAPAAAAPQM